MNDDNKLIIEKIEQLRTDTMAQFDRMAAQIRTSVKKETYLVEEVAEQTPFELWTIRQWCNIGRIQARKGNDGRWRIPHVELVRLQNEGPQPMRKAC